MTNILLVLAFLFASDVDTGKVRIVLDLDRSTLTWRGKKVIGNTTHHGTVDLSSGHLELEKGDLAGGEFELDMTSLRNQDLGPRMGSRLINHLKSEDFFDVDNFPKSSIIITKSRKVDEGVFDVFADLSIKNVTKEIISKSVSPMEMPRLTSESTVQNLMSSMAPDHSLVTWVIEPSLMNFHLM